MRKYILLGFISIIGLGCLYYLYGRSSVRLHGDHIVMMDAFSKAKQSDTALDKEILKIRSFLLLSYDSIVQEEAILSQFCNNPRQTYTSKVLDTEFFQAFDKHCEAIQEKMKKIELFKSKNAIYRNSLMFLHNKSTEQVHEVSKINDLTHDMVSASISYSLLPNEEVKLFLQTLLDRAAKITAKSSAHEELDVVTLHASRILQTKNVLGDTVQEIVTAGTQESIDHLHQVYLKKYTAALNDASFFTRMLFGASLLLFMFMIYSILGLWRSAKALADANAHLEERVRERTKELMASQKTITDQQEALMASSKMSALGEMAGGVAHEINTPLAVIQLYTDQILEMTQEPGEVNKEFLQQALTAVDLTVKRISKIIQGLRTFARDGQRDPYEMSLVADIINDTFGLCNERFRNHGVELKWEGDKEILLLCRPTEISQVLLNMLNNSYDAISELPQKWITVKTEQTEQEIILSVTDSGSGIPKDLQDKIMQPFFTTKGVGKGTGLGLSVSKGIVEAHKGKITVDTACPNTCIRVVFSRSKNLLSAA